MGARNIERLFPPPGKRPAPFRIQRVRRLTVQQINLNQKATNLMKSIKNFLALTLATLALAVSATAGELVNVSGASNIAVGGYDTVAFFTDKKPVHGDPGVSATHQGATYIFASQAHKDLFLTAPEKYLPQCGGFCAYGVAVGALFPVDVSTWQIRDGKLYLNLNKAILKKFNADFEGNAAKAKANWPGLVEKHGK